MKKKFWPLLAGAFACGSCCPPAKVAAIPPPPPPKVVLVHGIFETGTAYKHLRRRLEKQGMECFVPKLKHQDGRGGLDYLAEHLKKDIDREFGPDTRFSLVGFSMGGLVGRYYLQNLGGAERCETFFTISSPHHGTTAAHLYFSEGARQMRPGSRFLADLEETENRLGRMPVVSYRTPMDLVILPPASSIWDRAENHEFPVILHPLMLSSRKVLDDIENRLVSLNRTGTALKTRSRGISKRH